MTGIVLPVNVNLGYLGADLPLMRFVKDADPDHALSRLRIHGILGVGPADLNHNYQHSFLRMVHDELEINYSTVQLSYFNNSTASLTQTAV
jgi:hypothetical protein